MSRIIPRTSLSIAAAIALAGGQFREFQQQPLGEIVPAPIAPPSTRQVKRAEARRAAKLARRKTGAR